MTAPVEPFRDQGPEDDWDALLAGAFGTSDDDPQSVVERLDRGRAMPPPIQLAPEDYAQKPLTAEQSPGLPAAGDRIGHYLILGELARGGMGIVYQARDLDLGREVALKLLRPERLDDAGVLARFVEEAQVSGQLQHPGIVPIYEMGLDAQNRPWFAMKLIRGRTLSDVLRDRTLEAAKAETLFPIFLSLCQTLAYAHARKVVHRDIKPSNVMVGPFGEVQIVDFGLAKVLHARESDAAFGARENSSEGVATIRTETDSSASIGGQIFGTPAYMAPEQARGEGTAVDERADVFSLGAILCEILTGLPPYGRGESKEILARARAGELSDALARLADEAIDPLLKELCARCLAEDKEARPADAGEVAEAIEGWNRARTAAAESALMQAASAAERARSERRARRITVAFSTLFIATLLVSAAMVVLREREANDRIRAQDARSEQAFHRVREALEAGDRHGAEEALKIAQAVYESGATSPHLRAVLAGLAQRTQLLAAASERAQELREQERVRETEANRLRERLKEIASAPFAELTSEEYQAAFLDYGIDFQTMAPRAIEQAVDARAPKELREEIVLALDRWTFGITMIDRPRREPEPVRHIFLTANALDEDPWRRELRSAVYEEDREELIEIARVLDATRIGAESLRFLVDALRAAGETERARTLLNEAIPSHVTDAGLHARLAQLLLLEEDQLALAERHAAIAVALAPREARHHELLAQVTERSDGIEAALEVLEQGLFHLPGSDVLCLELAFRLRTAKRHDEALAILEDLLARDPRNPRALHELVRLHEARGDQARAREVQGLRDRYFGRRRRGAEPREAPAENQDLEWVTQATSALQAELEAALQEPNPSAADLLRAASFWHALSDHERAQALIDQALAQSDQYEVAVLAGRIASARGDYGQATAAFDLAVERGARSVAVDFWSAAALRAARWSKLATAPTEAEIAALSWRDRLAYARVLAQNDRNASALRVLFARQSMAPGEPPRPGEDRRPGGQGETRGPPPEGAGLGPLRSGEGRPAAIPGEGLPPRGEGGRREVRDGGGPGFGGRGPMSGSSSTPLDAFVVFARAGLGLGTDQERVTDAERAQWRRQAQHMLSAQVRFSASLRGRILGRDLVLVLQAWHWQKDERLREIRSASLKLPEDEAQQWRALWQRVDESAPGYSAAPRGP